MCDQKKLRQANTFVMGICEHLELKERLSIWCSKFKTSFSQFQTKHTVDAICRQALQLRPRSLQPSHRSKVGKLGTPSTLKILSRLLPRFTTDEDVTFRIFHYENIECTRESRITWLQIRNSLEWYLLSNTYTRKLTRRLLIIVCYVVVLLRDSHGILRQFILSSRVWM